MPWSHNVLTADAASVYTCHSRAQRADEAGVLRFRRGGPLCPTHTWRPAHTEMHSGRPPAPRLARLWRPHVLLTGLRANYWELVLVGLRGGPGADVWPGQATLLLVGSQTSPAPVPVISFQPESIYSLRHRRRGGFLNWGNISLVFRLDSKDLSTWLLKSYQRDQEKLLSLLVIPKRSYIMDTVMNF